MKKDIGIVGSQMDLGAVRKGVDMGPLAIRHSGLIRKIQEKVNIPGWQSHPIR